MAAPSSPLIPPRQNVELIVPGEPSRRKRVGAQTLVTQAQVSALIDQWNAIGKRLDGTLDAHAQAIAARQQETAHWAIEHAVLLRVLIRKGVITPQELVDEREAVRREIEAAAEPEQAPPTDPPEAAVV